MVSPWMEAVLACSSSKIWGEGAATHDVGSRGRRFLVMGCREAGLRFSFLEASSVPAKPSHSVYK